MFPAALKRKSVYLVLLLTPLSAMASLGGNPASVDRDMTILGNAASAKTASVISGSVGTVTEQQARDITPTGSAYQVKEFTTGDGTTVREYLNKDTVFGVAWQGPVIPDLQQLFGSANYEDYSNALSALHKTHSPSSLRRAVTVSELGLVVHSFGRVPHFSGTAYIPHLVPINVSTTVVR